MPDQSPSKKSIVLLTFTWGAGPTVARYTSWTRDVLLDGDTFLSEPSIELSPGTIDGGPEEKTWRVRMAKRLPMNLVCRPYRFPDVTVTIEEYDPDNGERYVMYQGVIVVTVNNKRRQPLLCEFQVGGIKTKLKHKLGVVTSNICAWVFGMPPCCFDLSTIRQTATVVDIVNDTVLVLNALNLPPGGLGHWSSGAAEFDDLTLDVQFAIDQTSLVLAEAPPPEWIGNTVLLTPGCPGTLPACRIYNNEARFGGMGIAMPDFNPIIGNKS